MPLRDLLEQNRAWAARQVSRDPGFFNRLVTGQHPRLLWIGCSDSRVPAEEILGCRPGDLFVHRNIANIVAYNDVNIAAAVQYALEHLKVQDIVVCGHYVRIPARAVQRSTPSPSSRVAGVSRCDARRSRAMRRSSTWHGSRVWTPHGWTTSTWRTSSRAKPNIGAAPC